MVCKMPGIPPWWVVVLLAVAVAFLTSCSPADLLPSFGGTNVVAPAQIGAENNQTIGPVTSIEPQQVDHIEVNNTSFGLVWLLLAAAVIGTIGWIAPQPKWMQKWKQDEDHC